MTPNELKNPKINEGTMLREGADLNDEGKLVPSEGQVERAKKQMDQVSMMRNLKKALTPEEIDLIIVALGAAVSGVSAKSNNVESNYGQANKKNAETFVGKLWQAKRITEEMERKN
ncbi:MAG: hypothetical protein COT91_02000 [Candidatus Doudnabacteria bacterium CG10_big_fil_rev_8_21_14_0_10_41_10]|uniref:Uncharacterized protein n=1 Tax=Candidatus Doudnabacteria bacterium CG10_big_fil_rev_8_21_14_0_10_41_10 TaxID=1974551 RepID=A0A2H0VE12_9BACT|nr:MAG: hypothetical protein COT91_02000 [Candidatus Doudnabacteria bacterium CG10_big_fil_rev_8_21_14_0_10_41_10]